MSCNAYFAQLGVFSVGAKALSDTAKLLDIPAGSIPDIQAALPFAAYGQGPVLVTPFKMARVAATIAANGAMPEGRWVIDSSNDRSDAPPKPILAPELAAFLASAMRSVVAEGTGRRAMQGEAVSVAGKTGTAQLDRRHAALLVRRIRAVSTATGRRASRSRWWWSTADTARRPRRRSRARSWMRPRNWDWWVTSNENLGADRAARADGV